MTALNTSPYSGLPDHCFWSRSHRSRPLADVDPVVCGGFRLTPKMRIATAGSCFAQHIARHLQQHGYNYLVTEAAHPTLPPELATAMNYGTFSARFGNLYTARQLLQLAQRAQGKFTPTESVWTMPDGRAVDPFRPAIQPGGFASQDELALDRKVHFAAVRDMLEQADVFIFTFGLTEAWQDLRNGAVYPLAPGVSGGTFDPRVHGFINFTVAETVSDFTAFAALLRSINPGAHILMTVSPVPLMATARASESVIAATSYSKSVLRVACEELRNTISDCHYFPSYEIITGAASRGRYYGANLRQIEPAGVAHVMRLFMRHYTTGEPAGDRPESRSVPSSKTDPDADLQARIGRALDVICDEELIENAQP